MMMNTMLQTNILTNSMNNHSLRANTTPFYNWLNKRRKDAAKMSSKREETARFAPENSLIKIRFLF